MCADKLMQLQHCIGCGLVTKPSAGPVHKYLESSPGCWAMFGEVLAREYGNYEYMSVHGLTVDAYALQHPGRESPQTTSSVYVHLGSLYSYFELGKPVSELSRVKQALTQHKSKFVWLEPPGNVTEITVADIHKSVSASQHRESVRRWAAYEFGRWKKHHARIAGVLELEGAP